jgi:3-oxoacyl-[acyl-carrier protein] reductase
MTRTAVVTGGSGGIGRSCIKELSTDHNVVIHYNTDQDSAKSLEQDLRSQDDSNQILVQQCDISNPTEVENMFRNIQQEFDSIDVLINNAGVVQQKEFEERSPESMDLMVDVNLMGTIYCTQAALPHLTQGKYNHIVNVASTAGTRGSRTDPIYGASKGGMIAFAQSIAREYTKKGLFVNTVAPATVNTARLSQERINNRKKEFPLQRVIEPDEVSEAVRFLSTTTSISGEIIEIDGGRDF